MCTAICATLGNHYFGRNLDYEHTFGEKVTVTPRNFVFQFRNGKEIKRHYAMIGMALTYKDYPLYFDATNEKGLSMAGLNFPENAKYRKTIRGKDNVASFELIPWILSQCATTKDAERLLRKINITDDAMSPELSPTPLHWLVGDREKALTVEQTQQGISVYENTVGVLTNNPSFDIQMFNLSNYMQVSAEEPENHFSQKILLKPYSRGMGGLGIPGDLSSMSRFVKTCFTKLNLVCSDTQEEQINQFFHMLYSVYQQKGCVKVGQGYEMTNYSSCCDTEKGIYYYTTYHNMAINGVDMNKENLEGNTLMTFDISGVGKFDMKN